MYTTCDVIDFLPVINTEQPTLMYNLCTNIALVIALFILIIFHHVETWHNSQDCILKG